MVQGLNVNIQMERQCATSYLMAIVMISPTVSVCKINWYELPKCIRFKVKSKKSQGHEITVLQITSFDGNCMTCNIHDMLKKMADLSQCVVDQRGIHK